MVGIVDVGEKFGGARKDEDNYRLNKGRDLSGPLKLKDIWPRPKFKQLCLDGELSPQVCCFYWALYNQLAPTPPTVNFCGIGTHQWPDLWEAGLRWLYDRWLKDRSVAGILSLEDDYKAFMLSIAPRTKDGPELVIKACGRHSKNTVWNPFSFRGIDFARANYLWRLGWPYDERLTEKDGFCIRELYDRHDNNFSRPFYQLMNAKGKKIYFTEDMVRYETEEIAFEALSLNVSKILESRKLIEVDVPKKKGASRPKNAKRPVPEKSSYRIGPDNPRRSGDCSGEDVMSVLAFRGVEFGNWVPQDERQCLLNDSFDASYDLCSVLRLPAMGASLWGRLGLAFGSRGRGGSAAHYSSDKHLIHINRYPGVGSYAHEFGHALDCFLGSYYGFGEESYISEVPLDVIASHDLKLAELVKVVLFDCPSFNTSAVRNDYGRKVSYWNTNVEKFARGFETYIFEVLARNQRCNNFLVFGVENDGETCDWSLGINQYPAGQERSDICFGFHEYFRGYSFSEIRDIKGLN